MKVSRNWLQKYFEKPLPSAEAIGDALTFHSFEIEEIVTGASDAMLDVKVLPDRAADCLSHRGIAREVGAVLDMALSKDSLREPLPESPVTDALTISIEDETSCYRYMSAIVRGVKVGPSPAWLRESLESVGQRSINNVVDATNYVMLDIGQPLHAFDAANLTQKDGAYSIRVRGAYEEKITALTGEEYSLPDGTLLITDANADLPIGIAGVKGGSPAAITNDTTDIVIESASFNGTLVRKASQRLKLWTDASQRYQNKPSPELVAYAMRDVLKIITDIAGGEVEGVVDEYPESVRAEFAIAPVSVSLSKINRVLGSSYQLEEVEKVFDRLAFQYSVLNDVFTVTPPFERRDLTIAENLIEEVGRIIGYDAVAPEMLPAMPQDPDQNRFRGIERIKDFLITRGYTEISTQTFAVEGDVHLANPLDQTRPALRMTLARNMSDALARAASVAPRVLGPATELKLFELGTVFGFEGENLSLVLGVQFLGKRDGALLDETTAAVKDEFGISAERATLTGSEADIAEAELSSVDLASLGEGYEPKKILLGAYRSFSVYPFALRDVAVWTPARTEQDEVSNIIIAEAGDLLVRIDLFDRFTKTVDGEEKISYAFRLVFESSERTLSDEDLNPRMEKITVALNANDGWQVR